ncbi:hypothetical protein [Sphingobium yanoikuyae]|uniref:hypothetical protein n=1 Tax=Sphingobium yanoikuyae TaxID=13690 RepID=UPI0012D32683|nr:hypothetical protein [Sphingobium yanoikuyae]MDV3480850.1 hypothetical protein [Sphingobium yanoikuyae]
MIAILMWIAAAGDAATPTINKKVELDGRTYRVEIKGQAVEVFDKSAFTKRSPEAGVKLRRAVEIATGCKIRDAYWEAAHLAGILDCPGSHGPS